MSAKRTTRQSKGLQKAKPKAKPKTRAKATPKKKPAPNPKTSQFCLILPVFHQISMFLTPTSSKKLKTSY
jgi:hypothetical protein